MYVWLYYYASALITKLLWAFPQRFTALSACKCCKSAIFCIDEFIFFTIKLSFANALRNFRLNLLVRSSWLRPNPYTGWGIVDVSDNGFVICWSHGDDRVSVVALFVRSGRVNVVGDEANDFFNMSSRLTNFTLPFTPVYLMRFLLDIVSPISLLHTEILPLFPIYFTLPPTQLSSMLIRFEFPMTSSLPTLLWTNKRFPFPMIRRYFWLFFIVIRLLFPTNSSSFNWADVCNGRVVGSLGSCWSQNVSIGQQLTSIFIPNARSLIAKIIVYSLYKWNEFFFFFL